jgi:class 3 adenylate cyclase/pimeloyl-ACP methyl ester carboxylesterase
MATHAEILWDVFPFVRQFANRFRTITLDWRGCGLSERKAIDFSIGAMVRDLEAVVARIGSDSLVVGAWGPAVPIGVTYVTENPDRVSHLVLVDGFSRFSDFMQTPAYRALTPLLEMDLLLFTETIANVLWAHANLDVARAFAGFMRASVELDAAQAIWKAWESWDVTDRLQSVTTPTLIVQNRSSRLWTFDMGQRTAAGIPGARLVPTDDVTFSAVPDLVGEFVFGGEAAASAGRDLPSGMTAIFFADIADSTALTERLGDTAFRAKARDLDAALRTVIRDHAGTAIEGKLLGDGVLAVFTSARQAIEAALACASAGSDAGLPLHLGLHAGDVIHEEGNVYGGAVNIAARISALSAPGELLVSDIVRGLARTSAGVTFEDRGDQSVKGVGEPVRVWAVGGKR